MTKHAAGRSGDSKGPRSRQGASEKIWAVGLAGATCVGLVGVVGVRAIDDAAAAEPQQVDFVTVAGDGVGTGQAAPVVMSSSGLTEEQLDEYSRALQVERMRLEAYHRELLDVAAQLQESADAVGRAASASTVAASSNSTAGSQSASSSSSKKSSKKKDNSSKVSSAKPATPSPQTPSAEAPAPAAPAVPKPASKPVPKPAAAPNVAKPQAQTRGS